MAATFTMIIYRFIGETLLKFDGYDLCLFVTSVATDHVFVTYDDCFELHGIVISGENSWLYVYKTQSNFTKSVPSWFACHVMSSTSFFVQIHNVSEII